MQPLKKENLQSEETNNLNEQTKGAVNVLKKEDDQITIQQTRAIHTSSSDNKSL